MGEVWDFGHSGIVCAAAGGVVRAGARQKRGDKPCGTGPMMLRGDDDACG